VKHTNSCSTVGALSFRPLLVEKTNCYIII
jgi:hypothetical protein